MILIIDNFDSFTYNLVDYFHQLGVSCDVIRNDAPVEKIDLKKYQGVVLSPGPGRPEESGNLLSYIAFFENKLPVLGICLGHQALGQYYGATLTNGIRPMHGKLSEITRIEDPVFSDLPKSFNVVRYHSLILTDFPSHLKEIAWTKEGEVMAFRHLWQPVIGIQYHPEAILTEYGKELLQNWLNLFKITA